MIKRTTTVIFDFGGVLSLPQERSRVITMARLCRLSLEDFVSIYAKERPLLDLGTVGRDAYWSRILAAGGIKPSPDLINTLSLEDMLGWTRMNIRMLAWSRELRSAGFKTAILSNMPSHILAMMRTGAGFEWMADFHPTLFSCDFKLAKPHREFYRRCLEKLEEPAARCFYLDDIANYVAVARKLGIDAAVFRSEAETARQALKRGLPASSLEETGM